MAAGKKRIRRGSSGAGARTPAGSDSGSGLGGDSGARAWHALPVEEVLSALDASRDGLASPEAQRRLAEVGPNALPQEEREGPLRRFLRQFHDALIYVLLVAAVVTALLGEWIDSAVILAVVVINAIIGFVQEGKAEAALDAIRKMLSQEATVLRDGRRVDLPATDLVPGDVVIVESGDRVPADLRVLSQKEAATVEAALTGESEPVRKQADPVAEEAVVGDRLCMAYSTTVLTRGRLTGLVVGTGQDTEVGRIGALVSGVETLTTPLLRAVGRFGKTLSVIIVGVAALLFGFGLLFRDHDGTDLFLLAVSLAVAAIPEGLPAIMTITLALGVQRMARRNAIIRRLPAVETLGSVSVICSDKTGTLTRNEMTVREIVLSGASYEVTGVGYAPEGELREPGETGAAVEPGRNPVLMDLLRGAVLCSDAELFRAEDAWRVNGDPTEGAVIALGRKAGVDRDQAAAQGWRRVDDLPFESERGFMATLDEAPGGGRRIHLKGAPERVLERCDRERRAAGAGPSEAPLHRSAWEARIDDLASKGYRLLAVADRRTDQDQLAPDTLGDAFVLLGYVAMMDPPRTEAIAAVRECRQAGIRVKMITGDHALTARAIGEQLGIGGVRRALTGQELEALSTKALEEAVLEHDVFARASPEHKLRLVEALQSHGAVVAMTGDGVNDSPALKRADVGVAMGIKGSEAAKDASEMVLADDNFASIVEAVKEGRTVYDNLKKTILFILPTNGAEALMVISTVVFAFAVFPIMPLQILWVNMITAVTLAIALAFEPTERGIMQRPPRDPEEPILSGYLLWRIGLVSVVIAGLALALFFRSLDEGLAEAHARTMAVNALVAGQLFYLFNTRFILGSSFSLRGLLDNRVALVAAGLLVLFQGIFTYAPPMQTLFGTTALQATDWLWVLGVGLTVFLVVELEKAFVRALQRRRGHRGRRRGRRHAGRVSARRHAEAR